MRRYIYLIYVALIAIGCVAPTQKKESVATSPQEPTFTLPTLPAVISRREDAIEYLAMHYWDNFNFSDTLHLSHKDVSRNGFMNYIPLLAESPTHIQESSVDKLCGKAITANRELFAHFMDMAETFLYDPNSMVRNEELYIHFLRYITTSDKVEQIDKIRPQHQLEMALKNRIGEIATDFSYNFKDGKQGTLHTTKGDMIIIYFQNPDCHDCERVKSLLMSCEAVMNNPSITVLATYTDLDQQLWQQSSLPSKFIDVSSYQVTSKSLYDLRAIPNLYLLGADKEVILKDCTVEMLTGYLEQLSTLSTASN